MAGERVMLTNFYSAFPICNLSRSGLLTGFYPKRIGMGNDVYFPNDQRSMNPDEKTIDVILGEKGYWKMAPGPAGRSSSHLSGF